MMCVAKLPEGHICGREMRVTGEQNGHFIFNCKYCGAVRVMKK